MTEQENNSLGKPRIQHLEMVDIVKRFPGVLANDCINFDVHAGEMHALLGENGAGKSTLMRVLYGLYRPDQGHIRINEQLVHIASPLDAIRQGIGMIHQHFMLVPSLTVAENIALGLRSTRGFVTDLDKVSKRVLELADIYGLKVDPGACIWQLAVGQQQRVEILKALYRGADLLILDEPTAVLTPQEVDELFITLRQMKLEGHSLIFISHKLHEVLNISDRVTVLRDGRVVNSLPTSGATKEILAEMMVGREIVMQLQRPPIECGQARLELIDICVESDRGRPALTGVTLNVCSGEILGLAGVSGNGQRELAQVVTGLRPIKTGVVKLDGQDATGKSPAELLGRGLSYIPEERMKEGVIREFNVSENIILREHANQPYARMSFLNFKAIANRSKELVDNYNVKTPSVETSVKSLSGGNIQKIILARELSRQPKVLIAAQPTRGLDIGATEYVHKRLIEQRSEGTAILLISEDLDEILALSDRIAVIYEGRIMDVVNRDKATAEGLGLLMAGVRSEEKSI
jgi:simple sugar transport system ATP-binding protein